ncbi:MAG TPA: hypothetical protein PKI01_03110 [Bacteroidales bacterium]|nr:hypothetical protein [Bacteroidales bacterium]
MTTTKNCPQCGAEFQGRSNRLYCSDRCKMDAFYKGNNKSESLIQTDKQFEELPQKRLITLQPLSNQLVPVTVMLTPAEKESLEQQAAECGTELGKYIAVRSQMTETDVSTLEKAIESQKSDIQNLKIQLTFYSRGIKMPEQAVEGFLISMNQKQKDFLIHWYLESMEFDYEDNEEENELQFNTYKEHMEHEEQVSPGYIVKEIEHEFIRLMFIELEKTLKTLCHYDRDFDEDPLKLEFSELKK